MLLLPTLSFEDMPASVTITVTKLLVRNFPEFRSCLFFEKNSISASSPTHARVWAVVFD